MKVSKIDAAKAQLDGAIELWFREAHPVSVHTLAFAAHEIVHRLFRQKGGKGLMFDSLIIKDEYRNEYNKRLKKSAAFFKHADRETNPNDSIDFNEGINIIFITMTIAGLVNIGEKLNAVESAFMFWLSLVHPDWFFKNPGENDIPPETAKELLSIDKASFLEGYIQIWMPPD